MKNHALALAIGTALTTTAIGVGVGANPASALTFKLTFDIDDPIPVTSFITTEDFQTTVSGFTGYKIISITGKQGEPPFTGSSTGPIISLNAPGTTQIGPFAALNDNLYNPQGSATPGANPALAFFSQGGLAYTINENNNPSTPEPYQAFYTLSGNSLYLFEALKSQS